MKTETELEFDKKYTYNANVVSAEFDADDGQTGMLETFGDDLELVLEIAKKTPKRVWTMTDSDDGKKLILCAGYHLVNRVYYVITNEDFENENESYVMVDFNEK